MSVARNNFTSYLAIALYVCLVIMPMIAGFIYAVLYSFGLAGVFSERITIQYWVTVLSSLEILRSLGLSLFIAFATTLCSVGSGLMVGMALQERLQKGIVTSLVHIPLAIPASVAAFLVLQIFSGGGLAARLLLSLGFINSFGDFPSLVHDPLGLGIIAAHTLMAAPFFALLFARLHTSENISALTALASTLGANRKQRFLSITLPLLLRRSSANIILLFVAVLGSYEIPLLLGVQSPQMLSVLTHRKYAMFDLTEKPQAFVLAVIYTVVVLMLLITVGKSRGENNATQ